MEESLELNNKDYKITESLSYCRKQWYTDNTDVPTQIYTVFSC